MKGILFKPDMIKAEQERFWAKVDKINNDCWEWTASLINGYGQFYRNGGKRILAHRFAFEQENGEIPIGLQLDHLCRNHKCVNPKHLELVTQSENTLRGLSPSQLSVIARNNQLSKTHCPQGHPYDLFNTYKTPDGRRDCKICQRERVQEYRARRNNERNIVPPRIS